MMPMPHRLCKANGQAVGANIVDRAFFEQAMIGARGDRDTFAGAPVNRLRQAQGVVTRRGAVTQRHPGRARLAMQIDRPAIESSKKLAA